MMRRGFAADYKEFLLEKHFTTKSINKSSGADGGLTVRDVYRYSQNLKQSVELWYQILNPQDSRFSNKEKEWLEKLNRLGIDYVAPLLMAFFQKEKKKILASNFFSSWKDLFFS